MKTHLGQRLDRLILSDDLNLRRTLKLVLLGNSQYLLNASLTALGIAMGHVNPLLGHILVVYMLVGSTLAYLLVRIQSPLITSAESFVFPLCMYSVGAVLLGFAAISVELRGLVLTILPLTLMFGQFNLKPHQIRILGITGIAGIATITVIDWVVSPPTTHQFTRDGVQIVYIAGILVVCSKVAQKVSKLRHDLQRSKRELSEALSRVQVLATEDELTSLPNRRKMAQILHDEILRHQRIGTPFCVALIDLDHFKRINDTHGHQIGDEVLQAFSSRASEVLREMDVLARWGGEEFLLFFPATQLPQASIGLQRLRMQVALTPLLSAMPNLKVTFSAGLTSYQGPENIDTTIARADAALYLAKSEGRDRCVQSP